MGRSWIRRSTEERKDSYLCGKEVISIEENSSDLLFKLSKIWATGQSRYPLRSIFELERERKLTIRFSLEIEILQQRFKLNPASFSKIQQ